VDWTDLAQFRDKPRDLLNAVEQFSLLTKCVEIMNWGNYSVSRTLFRGASLILSFHLHLVLPSDTCFVHKSFNLCNFYAIEHAT
jgi:hypothetical protein